MGGGVQQLQEGHTLLAIRSRGSRSPVLSFLPVIFFIRGGSSPDGSPGSECGCLKLSEVSSTAVCILNTKHCVLFKLSIESSVGPSLPHQPLSRL